MKFLVLVLCVCAASAASYGSFGSSGYGSASSGFGSYKSYKPVNPAAATYQAAAQAAKTVAAPFQVAANAVASAAAPVAAPVAQAAATTYQAAQQVVTKNVPYNKDAEATILRAESEISPNGFNYVYETDNGISAQSVGTVKQVGDAAVIAVQGGYRYVAPDGTPVVFSYIADENGYQPQSDLLPVGPAIPEAIARSIAYIAAHPNKEYAEKY